MWKYHIKDEKTQLKLNRTRNTDDIRILLQIGVLKITFYLKNINFIFAIKYLNVALQ